MYIYFGDNSIFSKKIEEDIKSLGIKITPLTSSDQVGEAANEGHTAVILVNPYVRQVRSVRNVLGKLGGRVSKIPVVGVFEYSDRLAELDVLKSLDDFACGGDIAHEVEARVKALWARGEIGGNVIRCGELAVNQDSHQVHLSGLPIDLTYKEFELLRLLASTPGRAYSREDLLRNIWGYDYFGGTRTVDVHVRRLRAKIERHDKYIETVHGVGYRFTSRS